MALRIPRLRINRLWLVLGGAIVMGLLAAWLSVGYLKNRETALAEELAEKAKGGPTTAVVVVTSDVQKGTVITRQMLALRPVENDLLYEDVITDETADFVEGKKALKALLAGRPLRRSDVLDDRPRDLATELTPGNRALTVDIDEVNSFAQMLRPGNEVDLYLIAQNASGQAGDGQEIRPLLPKVRVVATGQTIAGEVQMEAAPGQAPRPVSYSNITLDVSPEQAVRIALATQVGKLRAVLRKHDEENDVTMAEMSAQELLNSGSGKKGGKGVAYIIGGAGGGGAAPQMTINIPSINVPGAPTAAGAPGAVGAVGNPAATAGGRYQPVVAGAPSIVNNSMPVTPTGTAR